MHARLLPLVAFMASFAASNLIAATGTSGLLTLDVSTNGVKTLSWPRPLLPALEVNQLSGGPGVSSLTPVSPDSIARSPAGYSWSVSNALRAQFYSLKLQPLNPPALLTANVLNRVAYGPTPADLERVNTIGAEAYLEEQLAMESPQFTGDPIDAYAAPVSTNSVPAPAGPQWTSVTVTGLVTTPTLYMYLTAPGSVSVDNLQFKYSYTLTAISNNAGVITTNIFSILTTNVLANGDFESPLTTGWTVSANHAGSFVDSSAASSGTRSLRLVASTGGTTQGSSVWQALPAAPATQRGTNAGIIYTNIVSTLRSIFSFAYVQSTESDLLTIRLSGNGLIISGREAGSGPVWIRATATGRATATPTLYVYLNGAGEMNVDNLTLVAGSVPDIGPNLLANGDFETGALAPWQATADFASSYVSDSVAFAGAHSLRLVATDAGGGNNDALFVPSIAGLTNGQTYTVSYWYTPVIGRTLTVRLSGSQLVSSPDTEVSGLRRRLDTSTTDALLTDLRAWFCARAVGARGQLAEVLLQFLENHFVTQHSKTSDYFDRNYNGNITDRLATALEFREISRWRQALANPSCTFYDLLKISAESPAMVIYLDTVDSRGDTNRIANENYARELYELFTMGVDNGYDQNDIVAMSRAWTGWTVDIKPAADVNNPFAPRSAQYGAYPGAGYNAVSNLVGIWTLSFNAAFHGTNRAPILSVWDPNGTPGDPRPTAPKRYPARFGAPWAGQSYQLAIPARTGTNGMQDGYDVIRHLADLAFTAEFISVKLCRLFIHDDFRHGVYDYTDPGRSAEAELVRQCIAAWNTAANDGRKGNIRSVLRVIFASDLFRSHGGSLQKIKTPLEFVASSVRALRVVNPDGTATASTDGYSFSSPLSRMGVMGLFNRADPDGYPEAGPPWISAGTLAERLRYVQSYLTAASTSGRPTDAGANICDPVALLKQKVLSANWRNAPAVTDYFLGILFPAEGSANLDLFRDAAIRFLNTADDGTTASSFASLNDTSATYDTRVRGMVSMLMTTQRFQEQ